VEGATQTLHRLTSFQSYDPERGWDPRVEDPRLVTDFEPNDLDRLPWFHQRYPPERLRRALPRDLPSTTVPAVGVLAGTAAIGPGELDLPHLSRLLHLSAGVVRTAARPYARYLFRAAGSAGGRFPLELYVAIPAGGPLPPGVHFYDPVDHALVEVGPAPAGAGATVVVTGVPWRTGWRYRERGYRHVYWDAGTMLSQLLAGAESAGIAARLFTGFPDARVAALVGADGVHEFPVAVVSLGGHPPVVDPCGPAAVGKVDASPREFPLVTAAQRAGDGKILVPAWHRGPAPAR
jgi:hypothetical protein